MDEDDLVDEPCDLCGTTEDDVYFFQDGNYCSECHTEHFC